ncbi:MAG: phosphatidylinositol kinase [Epsilonproteobacteria bacterium]|nr:MAG: phosphatidylinositol kinase [Campylobacterota bacterium]
MQKAKVYRNAEEIGLLHKDDVGVYHFQYSRDYLQNEEALSISVHFPLQGEAFSSDILFPFFFNLLAEGSIKEMQCRELKIDTDDNFTRLIKTTEFNTIGSITLKEVQHEMS